MYVQKQKELLKQYEKQEKKLKELKAGGKSTKQAVSFVLFSYVFALLDLYTVYCAVMAPHTLSSFVHRRNKQRRH